MPLTKEQQQANDRMAKSCYERLKASGRTCGGCDLQFNENCHMAKDCSDYLFGVFLPAIDPSGQTFGIPQRR